MQAVQLRESGDAFAHYQIDEQTRFERDIRWHDKLSDERLAIVALPDPEPGPGEVRVKIEAAGLNHLEVWAVKAPPEHVRAEPRIPGSDGAGRIDKIGPGVDLDRYGLTLGQAVIAMPLIACGACDACVRGSDDLCTRQVYVGIDRDGCLAEYVCLPAGCLLPAPPNLTFAEAASLPVTLLTARHMLQRAQLRRGERVLVQTGSSGVGVYAVQLARHLGAGMVLATVASPHKAERVKALGADAVLLHGPELDAELGRLAPDGVDVILDVLGGDHVSAGMERLAIGGRLVTAGATTGNLAQVHIGRLLGRHRQLIGSSLGSRAEMEAALAAVAAGAVKPVLDRTFPLAETMQAVRYLAERGPVGKVVITIGPEAKVRIGALAGGAPGA